ncbi:hypothetical protein D3C59_09325 [Streptomyces sp. SHP22-7]|nr:hypothetical protein D3C59_09325 [Streptomyces sp. SHP22-7]
MLPAAGVTYDQVPSVGVQPSPVYDVDRVRRHATRAYHRLVRPAQLSASPRLLRDHSLTADMLAALTGAQGLAPSHGIVRRLHARSP